LITGDHAQLFILTVGLDYVNRIYRLGRATASTAFLFKGNPLACARMNWSVLPAELDALVDEVQFKPEVIRLDASPG
jgi:hypothetical protein